MKKIFLSLILSTLSLAASDLAIFKTPSSMSFSTREFSAVVPNYMVNKKVRDMDATKLAALLEGGHAYLSFNECSDGNYAVDIHGRVRGGGPFGAIEGAAAGGMAASEGSKLLFVCGSYAVLFLVQGAVHVFAGAEQGAIFRGKLDDRFLPAVHMLAQNVVGPAFGMAGAGAGAVIGGAASPI